MTRLARPLDNRIPMSADRYKPAADQPVVVTYAVGANLRVRTYCGIELTCRVVETQFTDESPTYVVVPTGDRKIKELRSMGVWIDDANPDAKFNVFAWQIL